MIGSYLQQLRADAGASRSLLARRAGVSRITLWRWERGETLPRRLELQATLEALNATPQQHKQALTLYSLAAPCAVELAQVRQGKLILHRGDLLVALRGRRGWTQEEAAARAEVPRVTLARWENMNTWPPDDRLHRLCYAYEVTPEELLAITRWQPDELLAPAADLDALRAHVQSWSNAVYQLDELDCLATAGRLDRLTQEHPEARGVLCSALLFYANHLINRYRLKEAGRYLRRASSLLAEADPLSAVVHLRLEAYAQRLRFREDKRLTRSRCGVLSYAKLRPLADAVAGLPPAYQATILGDTAVSLAMMGRSAEADQVNARALLLAQEVSEPMRLQRLLERHWLLSEAGRYAEAVTIQPDPTGIAFMDAYFMVMRGKALLGAGSKAEGKNQLEQAYQLGKARDWPAVTVGALDLLQRI